MAKVVTTADDSEMSFINPMNLINAGKRLFDAKVDDDETGKTNLQGEAFWTLVTGYILGNSLGTNNTIKGGSRLHLGPVYIW